MPHRCGDSYTGSQFNRYSRVNFIRRVCSKEKSAPKLRKKTHLNHQTTAHGPGSGGRGAVLCCEHAALPTRPSRSHLAGARSFTRQHRGCGRSPGPARLSSAGGSARAALRRVRLRAKGSAEPAEPARLGPGVTPALSQCLWQGGGLWAGPPPLTEPQHRDAVAAGDRQHGDTARTGPARRCHNPAAARDYNSRQPLSPNGAAGSWEPGERSRETGTVSREARSREPGNEQLGGRLSPELGPGPGERWGVQWPG